MRRSVLIVGSSGHGRAVLDVVRCHYALGEIALLDDFIRGISQVHGVEYVGGTDDIGKVYESLRYSGVIVAIGDNWNRRVVVEKLKMLCPDIKFLTMIHSSAYVSRDAVIGEGSVVMPGAVVGPGTRIGPHCVINSRASVDHDCSLADFASVAPGVTLGGNVSLGEGCFVGLGANIIQRVCVGRHTVIGAGSTVLSNIGDNVVAYGTPAKEMKSREPEESCL